MPVPPAAPNTATALTVAAAAIPILRFLVFTLMLKFKVPLFSNGCLLLSNRFDRVEA
jgi:hypothetical protein